MPELAVRSKRSVFKLLSTPFPRISCVLAPGEDALTCPCNSPHLKPQSKSQETEERKEGVLEGDRGAKLSISFTGMGACPQQGLPKCGSRSVARVRGRWWHAVQIGSRQMYASYNLGKVYLLQERRMGRHHKV